MLKNNVSPSESSLKFVCKKEFGIVMYSFGSVTPSTMLPYPRVKKGMQLRSEELEYNYVPQPQEYLFPQEREII